MIITDLNKAIIDLQNNNIIAIPTETVYGLAANAYSETAVKKIFELKKRPLYNPLIVHIKSTEYLKEIAQQIPDIAYKLATKFWPGPLTLVLKKQPHLPNIITAGKETVAIRMPNHPVTLSLLDKLNFPLAAPSANPFGSISPTSSAHVEQYFKNEIDVLEGGSCTSGIESTIIGFENNQPVLYRHGSIAIEEIEAITGKLILKTLSDSSPNAPGMLTKHYAPNTKTLLSDNIESILPLFQTKKIGLLLFTPKKDLDKKITQEILSKNGDLNEAMQNFYAALHRLDKMNLDLIIAEKYPNHGLGKTINDRLQRAVIN